MSERKSIESKNNILDILDKLKKYYDDFCGGECVYSDIKAEYIMKSIYKKHKKNIYVKRLLEIPEKIKRLRIRFEEEPVSGERLILKYPYRSVEKENKCVSNTIVINCNKKNSTVSLLGLRICNKNTKNMNEIRKYFIDNFYHENKLEYKDELEKLIVFKNYGKFSKLPGGKINVSLKTNSLIEKSSFYIYHLIIEEEGGNLIFSDPFSVMCSKQFVERTCTSSKAKKVTETYLSHQFKLLEKKKTEFSSLLL